MNSDQALEFLQQITGQIPTNRPTHEQIILAISILRNDLVTLRKENEILKKDSQLKNS